MPDDNMSHYLSDTLEAKHQRQLEAAGPREASMPPHSALAAMARALEERVAEMEGQFADAERHLEVECCGCHLSTEWAIQRAREAIARAEAAEAANEHLKAHIQLLEAAVTQRKKNPSTGISCWRCVRSVKAKWTDYQNKLVRILAILDGKDGPGA